MGYKIKDIIKYLWAAKIRWGLPKKSQVLCFDSTGNEYLMPYFKKWNPTELNINQSKLEIFILIAILSVFEKGRYLESYGDAFIKIVKPKLIISHIDNSINFWLISQKHPSVKTIIIQNGLRTFHDPFVQSILAENLVTTKFQVDYMFTLGNSIGLEYKKHVRAEYIPLGGLKNNAIPKVYDKEEGSIIFISQFRGLNDIFKFDSETITGEQFFELSDQVIISHLVSYAKRKKKSFHIATYNMAVEQDRSLQEEIAYYNRLAGESLDYKIRKDLASSYEAVDKAEVVVTIDSTIGYESAVRGNKTAFFSIRGSQLQKKGYDFGWPAQINKNGSFWTNEANKMNFENILNYLFDLTQKGWEEELIKNNFEEYICYDPGNSKFKTKIDKIMSDK